MFNMHQHAVMLEQIPTSLGKYQVYDTGVGATYVVDEEWLIEHTIAVLWRQ